MAINKTAILEYLKNLNKSEVIKIQNSDKERRIFKESNKVFEIFGKNDKGVLNPFNDYSYEWLNTFLYNVIDLIEQNDFKDYDELSEKINDDCISEWTDSETDIYTSNLTEWLNSSNENVYYLTDALQDCGEKDGFKALQLAQYKAIEECFSNALSCLIEDLKNQFEEIEQEQQ